MKLFSCIYFFLVTLGVSLLLSCTSDIDELLPPSPESLKSSSSDDKSSSSSFNSDEFIDQRDGKKYKYEIAPGGQIWMSENLNYSANGTIGYCYDDSKSQFSTVTEAKEALGTAGKNGKGCNSPYGRAYNYEVIKDDICPEGWHIPSATEWSSVEKMSNSFYVKAGKYNLNANYLPLGWKDRDSYGYYWTSTTSGSSVKFVIMTLTSASVDLNLASAVDDYFSVRCIMDEGGKLPCGSSTFNPATQFCVGGKKYSKTCDDDSELPDDYLCHNSYVYKEILIDGKGWLASNLSGGPYNWAQAMKLASSCNSSDCTSRIEPNHQGMCPSGWHIPERDEIPTDLSGICWTATQEQGYEEDFAYYYDSSYGIYYTYKIDLQPVCCAKNN